MARARLAVLNSMAGAEVEASMRRQVELGLVDLDLKDQIFGRKVADLTDDEAKRLVDLTEARGMTIYCLSTHLFNADVEQGPEYFDREIASVDRVAELVGILRPRMVRLLACQAKGRPAGTELTAYLDRTAPWLVPAYRRAIELLSSAGTQVTVENEVAPCLLTGPDDVSAFFTTVDMGQRVSFTWDVQNMWQCGTPPSMAVYERLRPLIGYLHLKGGQADSSGALRWRSSLRDATWPIEDITRAAVHDGVSPVICLNPSHGQAPPGWAGLTVEDDLRFVRGLGIGVA